MKNTNRTIAKRLGRGLTVRQEAALDNQVTDTLHRLLVAAQPDYSLVDLINAEGGVRVGEMARHGVPVVCKNTIAGPSRAALVEQAKALGIRGYSRMNMEQLRAALS